MKPFCGYHFGDYFAHWLSFDRPGARLPKVFHVNWFRKDADGNFLWPGFGENLRVLEWIIGRVEGRAGAIEGAPGLLPDATMMQFGGMSLVAGQLSELFDVEAVAWWEETSEAKRFLAGFGDRMPGGLRVRD